MKKTLRSLVAMLVALMMVLSFVPAAFADDETEPQEVIADGGSVTKSYDGNINVADNTDPALEVISKDGYTAVVDVAGNVTNQSESAWADALYAEAYTGGTTEVHVGGDVSSDCEYNPWTVYLEAKNSGSTSTVTIDGSVTSTVSGDSAHSIIAQAENDGTAEVSVGKDVTAEAAGGYVYGVDAEADKNGSVTVSVGGDVTAEAAEGYVYGVYAEALDNGSVTVSVEGDVTAAGGEDALSTGVYMDVGVSPEVYGSYGFTPGVVPAPLSVEPLAVEPMAVEPAAVEEDAASAQAATVSVLINGTLSGDSAAVVLGDDVTEEDVENGNVKLTVWQVALGEGQEDIVQAWGYDEEEHEWVMEHNDVAAALEKAIQYIIKTVPAEGATLSLEGTTKEGDYDVALEGDTVALQVAVANGYELKGVYNGLGEKVLLVKDANGKYSVIVPRCGGVIFSVEMSKAANKPVFAKANFRTEDGLKVYFIFYLDGTYELICNGVYDRGTYKVENGALTLINPHNVEMPVAADGTVNFVFRNGWQVKLTVPADVLAKVLALGA